MAESDLIHLIYSAVEDSSRWSAFLEAFSRAIHCRSAAFWIASDQFPRSSLSAQFGLSDEVCGIVMSPEYRDPFLSRVDPKTAPLGKVLPSQLLCSDEVLEQDETYLRFLAPRDFHYGGGVMLGRAPVWSGMSALRSRAAGPLTEAEIELWQSLVPHLTAAVGLVVKQSKLTYERDALMLYFEDLGHGVILTGAGGTLLTANRMGRKMLDSGEGLRLVDGVLVARHPDCQRLLSESLYQASALNPPAPAHFPLKRVSGELCLMAVLLPAKQSGEAPSAEMPSAVLYLTDLTQPTEQDPSPLRHLYGLTQAESRLAGRLASGDSLAEAASRLGVSINTVRTHLQRSLAKTELSRQSELVILTLRVGRPITLTDKT